MTILPKVTFHLTVDKEELRLIVAGLHNGIREEDRAAATALQIQITEARVNYFRTAADALDKNLANMKAANG